MDTKFEVKNNEPSATKGTDSRIKNTATRTTFLIVVTKEHNQKQNLNLGI